MYKQYYSQEQWDAIVNGSSDPETKPHCNPDCFHRPGVCPYCDGYYKSNPGFIPSLYADEDQRWGGNGAPILDDVKSKQEDLAWEAAFDSFWEEPEDPRKRVDEIVEWFKEPS